MKLVGIVKFNNEGKENLERCLTNMSQYCNEMVCYDDGSTDNSVEIASKFTKNIILGGKSDFINESKHRNTLLKAAVALDADWIFWLDADEIIEKAGINKIRKLCDQGDKKGVECWEFNEVNLWRSKYWHRVDNKFGDGWFNRLWKNNGHLYYDIQPGLHLFPAPIGLKARNVTDIKVIHFGFSSIDLIIDKYRRYVSLGRDSQEFERFFNELNIKIEPVNLTWFDTQIEPLLKIMRRDEWTELIQKF